MPQTNTNLLWSPVFWPNQFAIEAKIRAMSIELGLTLDDLGMLRGTGGDNTHFSHAT